MPYAGDPTAEATLVEAEEQQLTRVRTVTVLTGRAAAVRSPYRVVTQQGTTLVLPARATPYSLPELARFAPISVVRQSPRTFLIAEDIVVRPNATLSIEPGLEVRLASDPKRFVAIVNDGGVLVVGRAGRPKVHIGSWDAAADAPDTRTADGRAYVRSIGGHVVVNGASFARLGFWSGPTGGLSMVGRDRPSTQAMEDFSSHLVLPQELTVPAVKGRRARAAAATRLNWLPRTAPIVKVPSVDLTDPRYASASGLLTDASFEDNAYGLFVANASDVKITNVRIDRSLIDGLVLHRYVAGAAVRDSMVRGSARDGVVISRSATGNALDHLVIADNRRHGMSVLGEPLAQGPNPSGAPVAHSGGNVLTKNTILRSGGHGVSVVGGQDITIAGNVIKGGESGVIVAAKATRVGVRDNIVENPVTHGIAVIDGASDAIVTGNQTTAGQDGYYVRDARALVRANRASDSANHGITLVGDVAGSVVRGNTIVGVGPSAVDLMRARGIDSRHVDNDTEAWVDTTPWQVTIRRFAQPLTLLWLAMGLMVAISAIRGFRPTWTKRHPYADKRPLTGDADVTDRPSGAAPSWAAAPAASWAAGPADSWAAGPADARSVVAVGGRQ